MEPFRCPKMVKDVGETSFLEINTALHKHQ